MKKEYIKVNDLRLFALIWSVIFGVLGLYNSMTVLFYLMGLFLIVGVIKPIVLSGFYKIWIKVGEFIGGIISKIIMFILYFGLFTPIAIFLKIFGKDLLNKKLDKSKKSYWIDRKIQPQSMKNQF